MDGKKVLIVDDEIHIVQVVSVKFGNNGYEIISAQDGDDAYELACEHNPDVIITDLQMPHTNGIELIEKLRSNDATRETPVVVLTAKAFGCDAKQKLDLNISAILNKPFSPKELLCIVEDVLCSARAV